MNEPSPGSPREAVMITGASTGIGRATTLHLAGKGLRVFAGVRKPADGEAVAKALGSSAPQRLPPHADPQPLLETRCSPHQTPRRLTQDPHIG